MWHQAHGKKPSLRAERDFLDGPDVTAHYWADKRLPRSIFRRDYGIGGISWCGEAPLVIVIGTINAGEYSTKLDDFLLTFTDEHYPKGYIYQQDNAPAHSALHTKDWFLSKGIDVLQWTSRLPDLNVIENAWGHVVQKLYAEGGQFDTVEDLKGVLFYEWQKINLEYRQSLIRSMPDRVRSCQNKRGGETEY